MDYVAHVKQLAYQQAQNISRTAHPDPLTFLRRIAWPIGVDTHYTQEEVAQHNLTCDMRGCLGRAAVALALLHQNFPNRSIRYAEVLQDALCEHLLPRAVLSQNESMLSEVLRYEEPHAVPWIDGAQFDPLEAVTGFLICHPRVKVFPSWEGLTSAWIMSFAYGKPLPERRQLLTTAEAICPGTTLVLQHWVGLYIEEGDNDTAITYMQSLLTIRPTARLLFCLYLLTGDPKYRQELLVRYSPTMYGILTKELDHEHR